MGSTTGSFWRGPGKKEGSIKGFWERNKLRNEGRAEGRWTEVDDSDMQAW
jgi:hypothetical protein